MNVSTLLKEKEMYNVISTANNDPAISQLFLFGSHARGEANAFSDIDIAVIINGEPNRAALNRVAAQMDINFTYVDAEVFRTDDHCLHVSSSIKKEGILIWQR